MVVLVVSVESLIEKLNRFGRLTSCISMKQSSVSQRQVGHLEEVEGHLIGRDQDR